MDERCEDLLSGEPAMKGSAFELAKLDYARLAAQEQALMSKRSEHWTKFFTILIVPSSYAGVVGLQSAVFVLALIPLFITCIALEIKHDEQVLRYDVRKSIKQLAATYGFKNHESQFSNQEKSRWWHGYYKYGRAAAYLVAQIVVAILVCQNSGLSYSIELAILNTLFCLLTAWCLL